MIPKIANIEQSLLTESTSSFGVLPSPPSARLTHTLTNFMIMASFIRVGMANSL
jgi:hypothetical protein